jgi:hypothetical protein
MSFYDKRTDKTNNGGDNGARQGKVMESHELLKNEYGKGDG